MSLPLPRAAARRAVTGGVLVVVGLALWLGYALAARSEAHSYTGHQPPPRYVALEAGQRYVLGVPGGRAALVRAGVAPDSLQCTAAGRNGASEALGLTVEGDGTKATTQIASFRAPFGGDVHVTCDGVARVYVDNTSGDPSGLLLVAAMAVLAVGLPLALSAARGLTTGRRRPQRPQRPQDGPSGDASLRDDPSQDRSAGSTQPPNARSSS